MTALLADSALGPHSVFEPPLKSATAPARSLSEAVAAVTEHNLRTEMRRVSLAYASTLARADASVTLPRAAFEAMQRRLREFSALRRALDRGALLLVAFDAAPPHDVRELTLSASGEVMADATSRARPLAQCVPAGDALRVQRALLTPHGDLTMTVQWRRVDATGQWHLLHLLPLDPAQPGTRLAYLLRLSREAHAAQRSTQRALTKPPLRPRLAAWSLQPR
jgi:hypothetical protein